MYGFDSLQPEITCYFEWLFSVGVALKKCPGGPLNVVVFSSTGLLHERRRQNACRQKESSQTQHIHSESPWAAKRSEALKLSLQWFLQRKSEKRGWSNCAVMWWGSFNSCTSKLSSHWHMWQFNFQVMNWELEDFFYWNAMPRHVHRIAKSIKLIWDLLSIKTWDAQPANEMG